MWEQCRLTRSNAEDVSLLNDCVLISVLSVQSPLLVMYNLFIVDILF